MQSSVNARPGPQAYRQFECGLTAPGQLPLSVLEFNSPASSRCDRDFEEQRMSAVGRKT